MLHAYVGCLEPAASIFLLLLGASPGAFHALAAQRVLLEADLLAAGTLLKLRDAAAAADGGRPSIPALPPPAGALRGGGRGDTYMASSRGRFGLHLLQNAAPKCLDMCLMLAGKQWTDLHDRCVQQSCLTQPCLAPVALRLLPTRRPAGAHPPVALPGPLARAAPAHQRRLAQ
jgi:hypothetical protein